VLDGQSLWRVARRISPAMNASNNQMMWALFKANPEAFSDGTIESLRAGSFLSIPSARNVVSVPDFEAKIFLDSLSAGSATGNAQVEQTASIEANSDTPEAKPALMRGVDLDTPDSVADRSRSQFQLGGLGSRVVNDGSLVSVGDTQAKEIIESFPA